MAKKYKGEILILMATICWSLSGVLTTPLTISPILSNGLRCFIAVFMLLIYNKWKIEFNKTIFISAIFGGLTITLFFASLGYTTAANAVVIQYTAPIMVLMYNCLKEKKLPTKAQIFAVILAFSGVYVIFASQISTEGMLGNLFALLAGVCFSGVFIVNNKEDASPISSSIIAFSVCSLMSLFYIEDIISMDSTQWLFVVLLGIFQHGLAYIFFGIGIKTASSFSSSLISTLEIVLLPLWVFLVFNQAPTVMTVIGSVMVVSGVLLNIFSNNSKRKA